MNRKVTIGLGSNLGDRLGLLRSAIKHLGVLGVVKKCSHLYETEPVGLKSQPRFLNAAVELETGLEPIQLLNAVKATELQLGRGRSLVRNSPRAIDLDILSFNNGETFRSSQLEVPHPRINERAFVLQPLIDLYPTNPDLQKSLNSLPPSDVLSVSRVLASRTKVWRLDRTLVLGIINADPLSFSDGTESLDVIIRRIESMAEKGIDIVDVGACSTRPGADINESSSHIELERLLPIISIIQTQFPHMAISVDSFRSEVADNVGDIEFINDISGGLFDSRLHHSVARRDFGYMAMHTRGTPANMNQYCEYDDLIANISSELGVRIDNAIDSGVSRWNIIGDPGLGFAKTFEQNREIIRRLPEFSSLLDYPLLAGPSRKGFIGQVLRSDSDRDFGTAGAVSACVIGGAKFVRVHNPDLIDTVRVLDSIYLQ